MLSKTISKFFLIVLMLGLAVTVTSCSEGEDSAESSDTQTTNKASESSDTQTTNKAKSTADNAKKSEAAKKVEAIIQEQLFSKDPALAEVKSLSCPNDINTKPGGIFDCEATASQGTFKVKVTMTNDKPNNIKFNTNGLLMLPLAEQLIQNSIKQQHKMDVAVDCGSKKSKIRLFKQVGESFTCDVAQQGNKLGTATIIIKDEAGQINAKWNIKQLS